MYTSSSHNFLSNYYTTCMNEENDATLSARLPHEPQSKTKKPPSLMHKGRRLAFRLGFDTVD